MEVDKPIKTGDREQKKPNRRRWNSVLKGGLGRKFGPMKRSPGKIAEILLD